MNHSAQDAAPPLDVLLAWRAHARHPRAYAADARAALGRAAPAPPAPPAGGAGDLRSSPHGAAAFHAAAAAWEARYREPYVVRPRPPLALRTNISLRERTFRAAARGRGRRARAGARGGGRGAAGM